MQLYQIHLFFAEKQAIRAGNVIPCPNFRNLLYFDSIIKGSITKERTAAAVRSLIEVISGLHQLDNCHLSSIATAGAGTGHSGVAAVTVSILGSDLVKQLLSYVFLGHIGQNTALVSKASLLTQGDHLLNHGLHFLSAIEGGFHLAVFQQIGNLLTQQGLSLSAGLTQLTSAEHERFLLFKRLQS